MSVQKPRLFPIIKSEISDVIRNEVNLDANLDAPAPDPAQLSKASDNHHAPAIRARERQH